MFQGHFGALEDTLGQISKISKNNTSFDHKYESSLYISQEQHIRMVNLIFRMVILTFSRKVNFL